MLTIILYENIKGFKSSIFDSILRIYKKWKKQVRITKKKYFEWQKNAGAFGGWASSFFFQKYISKTHTVIDFGCGGGFLLEKLNCSKRIGIEPNEAALSSLESKVITAFKSPEAALKELGVNFADIIISNNALEHTLNPLNELIQLRKLVKVGGVIHFLVPCDSIN